MQTEIKCDKIQAYLKINGPKLVWMEADGSASGVNSIWLLGLLAKAKRQSSKSCVFYDASKKIFFNFTSKKTQHNKHIEDNRRQRSKNYEYGMIFSRKNSVSHFGWL